MGIYKVLSSALFWVLHRRPSFYAALYLINVVAFALAYAFLFSNDFKDSVGVVVAFYFSVVTVTTLGFGDVTPNLNSTGLLVAVTSQVVSGVVLVGLFLNSLSQRLSDHKDAQNILRLEEERKIRVASLMVLLRSVVQNYFRSVSDVYKVTSKEQKDAYEIRPKDLFTEEYFDQIATLNMYSRQTRYGEGRFFADVLREDNEGFKRSLDGYITKYSFALPIEILKRLSDLHDHAYLEYPKFAMQIYSLSTQSGVKVEDIPQFMAFEHSSNLAADSISSLRGFHGLLLNVIQDVEEYLPDELVVVSILLANHVAPPVGSAITIRQ